MPDLFPEDARPFVSIILPTYNRARFLRQAFESIRAQSFADWELIVVDDGSKDGSRELIGTMAAAIRQPMRYVHQENQGAYGARNTGLDLARGRYIAFYDSDDYWLPHHLADCTAALEANPEVDWVYGACRIMDLTTGRELSPNTFYVDGRARPFLGLRSRTHGPVRVIEDGGLVRCMLLHGLSNGLQNSVIHRRLFEGRRFCIRYRNEAEDQLIVIRALAAGHRLAYIDNVHVIYNVHQENSSGAAQGSSLDKRIGLYEALTRGFEELRDEGILSRAEIRALNRRLSHVYFWMLGYSLLWQHGRWAEADAVFRRALYLWPWNIRYWKTYILSRLKTATGIGSKTAGR
jgi:glycosyltransferase involved in cell wall biosynthesis